ncbi:hypothetical protein MOX02_34530 [Methylobacterium oxalidis]|uniref:Uncharacterized protein n=1 Tax=Methylobacterium oxalidis TaxID=944322 RepID=A0A512J627_9HYPH|nr:hypothetical protein MOX02_34530 [Methylobacterium oxalidis]GLS66305.1 hypothetical protein GCM10007888_46870 [Methylobacterium oxalidis]
MLPILIQHAMGKSPPCLTYDPSASIKRPKTQEVGSWTDEEIAQFEERCRSGPSSASPSHSTSLSASGALTCTA